MGGDGVSHCSLPSISVYTLSTRPNSRKNILVLTGLPDCQTGVQVHVLSGKWPSVASNLYLAVLSTCWGLVTGAVGVSYGATPLRGMLATPFGLK